MWDVHMHFLWSFEARINAKYLLLFENLSDDVLSEKVEKNLGVLKSTQSLECQHNMSYS